MAWSSPDSWPTKLFSGDPIVILIAFLFTISLPVLVHLYFYATATKSAPIPLFVLLGPAGSGKTSLLTLLQGPLPSSAAEEDSHGRSVSPTRTSQIPSSPVTLRLPASISLASNRYRSENDDSSLSSTPYKLIDTPGHGKLRSSQALNYLSDPSLRGVIFFVDAASIDSASETSSSNLRDTASYLHDVLLTLQRRKTIKPKSKSKVAPADVPVLLAANKQDLFTALPPGAVRERLESEIQRVRTSRTHGLVNVGESGEEEPEEALGGDGEASFSFKMLREEFGIKIDVLGGSVSGEEAGKGVRRWEEWIGGCL